MTSAINRLHQIILAALLALATGASLSAAGGHAHGHAPSSGSDDFEFSEEVKTRQHLILVALGKEPADLALTNVEMLDVHSGTWKQGWDIIISGQRIAWTGPTGEYPGEVKETRDYTGLYAVPGFGESHKHIESSYLTPEYEAELVIPFGNTWTVEGSHEFSNVSGPHNVEFWLTPREYGSPLKIFVELGSATPPTPYEQGGGYYGYEEVKQYMASDPYVIGLGEVMDWPRVWNTELPGSERLWQAIQATLEADGIIEGHGAGLFDIHSISAFSAGGLSSEHETRYAEEAWDKLSRGTFLQMRYHVIPSAIPYFIEQGIQDWSHISLTTDDRDAAHSLEIGTQDYNLRLAIAAGAPLEAAYAMVSINTAKHARINHLVGSIAPGRFADVVLLNDPKTVDIAEVYSSGILAAKDGEYLLDVPKIDWPAWATDTINVGREIKPEDFVIEAPEGKAEVDVALLQPFYFEEEFMVEKMPVTDGVVLPDASRAITKVAVVDRYRGTGGVSKMFWKNVGPITPNSALACSMAHDLHNLWALGNDDAAMAMAINKIQEMNGGWVLVKEGKIAATLRLEIGGLMSARPPNEVADEFNAMLDVADTMEWIGQPGLPQRMRFAWLTCTPWKWCLVAPYEGNPVGFVNVTNGDTHPVVW